MESKRQHRFQRIKRLTTFNRTSMESKLDSKSLSNSLSCALLIEPVWNRNGSEPFIDYIEIDLLIEPVWNRNEIYKPPLPFFLDGF